MTTIVAIGCSHTYGTMLDGKQSSSLYNLNNNYAALLAKKNNFKCIHLSQPGGSNEFIHRQTIDWLTRLRKRDEDYVLLIGWTSLLRTELRYPEDSDIEHDVLSRIDQKYFPISIGQGPDIAKTKEFKRIHRIMPNLMSEVKELDMWASYALTTQRLLQKNNVKHIMFNTCEELSYTQNNKNIINSLDTTTYLNPTTKDTNFLYWGLKAGFKKTECWHLGLDAHIAWSKYLDFECKKLDYF